MPFTLCRFAWRSFFYFYPRPPQTWHPPFRPNSQFSWFFYLTADDEFERAGRGQADSQPASQTDRQRQRQSRQGYLCFFLSLRCYSKRERLSFTVLVLTGVKGIVGCYFFFFSFLFFFFVFFVFWVFVFWFFFGISFPNYKFVDKWKKKRGLSLWVFESVFGEFYFIYLFSIKWVIDFLIFMEKYVLNSFGYFATFQEFCVV